MNEEWNEMNKYLLNFNLKVFVNVTVRCVFFVRRIGSTDRIRNWCDMQHKLCIFYIASIDCASVDWVCECVVCVEEKTRVFALAQTHTICVMP